LSASRCSHFSTHGIGGWVCLGGGLETQEDKKNSLLLPDIELKIFGRKTRSVYWLRYHCSRMLVGWRGGARNGRKYNFMTVIQGVSKRALQL
jgi:hypothetical protein